MKSKVIHLLILFILGLWEQDSVQAQNISLTVVTNQKGAPAELKQSELKSILMGERQRWRNGNKITIALMKTNTLAGKYTCERIYHMSEDELKKFWLAQVFGGKAAPPAFFSTVNELLAFVADNPGAIGVVDMPLLIPGTRVVLIDGKRTL